MHAHAESPRRRVEAEEGEEEGPPLAAATPPRPGPPLPPFPARTLSSASSASFSSTTSSPRHRRRLIAGSSGSLTPSHGSHKPPLAPYKQALSTLRTRAYPRLQTLHLDLRRLTRKDLMALVDKVMCGHTCGYGGVGCGLWRTRLTYSIQPHVISHNTAAPDPPRAPPLPLPAPAQHPQRRRRHGHHHHRWG